MKHPFLKRLVSVLVLAYAVYLVADVLIHRNRPPLPLPKTADEPEIKQVQRFWDFTSCYYNGHAYREGVLPYHRSLRWKYGPAPTPIYTFLYQPIILWGFAGLTYLGFKTAYVVYALLCVAVLGGLIWLWRVRLLPGSAGPLLYLLCLFGFDSAFYRGFEAGNINTIDVALMWFALYLFVKDRPIAFILLMTAASLTKLFPIILLALLFFIEGRRKWQYVLWAVILVVAVHGATFALHPKAFGEYVTQKFDIFLKPLEGTEASMPSTMAILKDVVLRPAAKGVLDPAARGALDPGAAVLLLFGAYLGIAISVVVVSIRALKRLRLKGEDRRRVIVLLASLVFALILPHFKDYSYALLIPAAYVVITRQRALPASVLLAGIVMVPYLWEKLPGIKVAGGFLQQYGVVFITYGLWIVFLSMMASHPRAFIAAPDADG